MKNANASTRETTGPITAHREGISRAFEPINQVGLSARPSWKAPLFGLDKAQTHSSVGIEPILTRRLTLNILWAVATPLIFAWDLTAPGRITNTVVPQSPLVPAAWANYSHHQLQRREVRKLELDLTQTELPPQGTFPGVFVDAIEGVTKVKNREYPTLRLVMEIDRLKSDQTPFTIERRYTLNSRGQRKLRAETQSWLASKVLSPEDLKKFNPTKIFLHQPCQTTVVFETENGQTVARAANYLAAGEVKLQPSGKYVRAAEPKADAVITPASQPASAAATA